MGWEASFKGITGGIFEFGFCDAIQQLWAAFVYELTTGERRSKFAACVTTDEAAFSHRLFAVAIKSQANGITEAV